MTTEASRAPPFWCVRRMRAGGLVTRRGNHFRHPTRVSAEAEALRLATNFPGSCFVVLQAVSVFSVEGSAVTAETVAADQAPAELRA